MRYFKTLIYKLGGADYNVIQHCTEDTKKQYRNLGWSVLLCTLIAFISGVDITLQYTETTWIVILGAVLYATLIFSFDYFLVNNPGTKFGGIRVVVAAATVVLGSLALMVMLCQSKIDNKVRMENVHKITSCDSTYQAAKALRYESHYAKITQKEHYHSAVCYVEGKNGYAGRNYDRKHKYCITQDSLLSLEKAALDSTEAAYFATYQIERNALEQLTSNDLFEKASRLPSIFKTNWVTLLVAIAAFIIMAYIETQSLMLKFSLNPNDEYRQAIKQHTLNCALYTYRRLKKMQEHNDRINGLLTDKTYHAVVSEWGKDMLDQTLKKVPLNYKLSEYKRILEENGMTELADEINIIQRAVSNGSDTDKLMQNLLHKINRN